jgi:hypothetical protein
MVGRLYPEVACQKLKLGDEDCSIIAHGGVKGGSTDRSEIEKDGASLLLLIVCITKAYDSWRRKEGTTIISWTHSGDCTEPGLEGRVLAVRCFAPYGVRTAHRGRCSHTTVLG